MYFYEKTINDIGHGEACFHEAAEHGKLLDEETISVYSATDPVEMNLSGIQTKLIQLTGRFCEAYGSDLICTFADLQPFIRISAITQSNRWVIPVGIRARGVDHEGFILSRLRDTITNPMTGYVHVEYAYRKLLVLDIQDEVKNTPDDSLHCTRTVRLIDITHSIARVPQ